MVFTKSLKGQYSFKVIFKRGEYISNNNITLYILKNRKYENNNFLGICVSKKHGNSVVRNRLKRWAREAYKEIEKDLNKGYNIIILYKKNIDVSKLDFYCVKKELKESLEKLGI